MGSPFSGKASGPFVVFGLAADFVSLDAASLFATVVATDETAGPASGVSAPQPLRPMLKAEILNSRKVVARFMAKISLSVQSR